MSQFNDSGCKALTAGGAIAQFLLVKIASGKIAVAGLADQPIGVITEAAFADGDVRNVALLSKAGTIKCVAAAAVTQGAVVYGRAAGKVDDSASSSAVRVGVALEASGAANQVIEVAPC